MVGHVFGGVFDCLFVACHCCGLDLVAILVDFLMVGFEVGGVYVLDLLEQCDLVFGQFEFIAGTNEHFCGTSLTVLGAAVELSVLSAVRVEVLVVGGLLGLVECENEGCGQEQGCDCDCCGFGFHFFLLIIRFFVCGYLPFRRFHGYRRVKGGIYCVGVDFF